MSDLTDLALVARGENNDRLRHSLKKGQENERWTDELFIIFCGFNNRRSELRGQGKKGWLALFGGGGNNAAKRPNDQIGSIVD